MIAISSPWSARPRSVIWLIMSTAVFTMSSYWPFSWERLIQRSGSRMPSLSLSSNRFSTPPMDLTNGPKSSACGFGLKNTPHNRREGSSGLGMRAHWAARCSSE